MSNSDHRWWFFLGVEPDATKQATDEAYQRLAKDGLTGVALPEG